MTTPTDPKPDRDVEILAAVIDKIAINSPTKDTTVKFHQVALAAIRSLFPQIPKATNDDVKRITRQMGLNINPFDFANIARIINVWIDFNAANIGKEGEG